MNSWFVGHLWPAGSAARGVMTSSFGVILILLIIALYIMDQKAWAGGLLAILILAIII